MDSARLEAASTWRLRAHALGPAEQQRFNAWMSDPANADAYAQVDAAWDLFGAEDDELSAMRARTRTRVKRRRMLGAVTAVAATVALSAGGLAFYAARDAGDVYDNPGVAPQEVRLADGSHLTLDARSRVKVRYDAHGRHFDLEQGQAAFKVFHDPSRPFEVKVGETRVTALGTTFNIDRWNGGATVTLLEGKVRVTEGAGLFGAGAQTHLSPGQQVTATGGQLSPVSAADTGLAEAWRKGELVFSDASLAQAVARVNRYGGPQVRLADTSMDRLRITGMFRAGDSEAFATSVARLHGLSSYSGPDGIVLQAPE